MIMYAAKYRDVGTVVNISGRFDLKRGIEGRLGKDFLQRIKRDGYIDVKNKRGKLSKFQLVRISSLTFYTVLIFQFLQASLSIE